jgi:hypothetical protein
VPKSRAGFQNFLEETSGSFRPCWPPNLWQHAAAKQGYMTWSKIGGSSRVFLDSRMMPRTVATNLHAIGICKLRETIARAIKENIRDV